MNELIIKSVKEAWDGISLSNNMDIVPSLKNLDTIWWNFLKKATETTGFVRKNEEKAPTSHECQTWINSKLHEMGESDKRAGADTQRSLGRFKSMIRTLNETTNDVSEAQLKRNGFNLEFFKDTLKNMSQYMAAVAGLRIPERITEFCKKEDVGPIINEDDLFTSNMKFRVCFIVDNSMHMDVKKVRKGLISLLTIIQDNDDLRQKAELYIITTACNKLIEFKTIEEIGEIEKIIIPVTARRAKIVDALNQSINDLYERTHENETEGIYTDYCPWMIILSDGWSPKYNKNFDEIEAFVRKCVDESVFKLYIRTLKPTEEIEDEKKEMLQKLDPDFKSLKDDITGFFRTARQSGYGFNRIKSSCGDGIDLPNKNGI